MNGTVAIYPSKAIRLTEKVLVFRTSVAAPKDVAKLSPLLNRFLSEGTRWNFDLEDWEHILRIEGKGNTAGPIIMLLMKQGFYCEELED